MGARLDLRGFRVKSIWLVVLPFLWFAAPTTGLLILGGAVATLGLLVRAWAAGTIRKQHQLATTGPYAFTRNPLYLGSFLIGIGVTITAAHWIWPALFLVFFAGVYSDTMAREVREIEAQFGQEFRDYALSVPAFFPRMLPYRSGRSDDAGGFRIAQYRHNREWEALLGVIAAFVVLALKSRMTS